MEVIVIGGGASGMMFASQFKKKNSDSKITVFEKGKFVSWAGCTTPYYISNELDFSHVVLREPQDFITKGINVKINFLVTSVNFDEKYVLVNDEKYFYDKLVIAVGARAKIEKEYTLNNASDAIKIKDAIDSGKIKSACIVAGSFVCIDLAESFIKRGINVTLLEANNTLFPDISENIKTELFDKIKKSGLNFLPNTKEYNLDKFDMIVYAKGIIPNIDFLEDKLKTLNGKIIVNEYFETSIQDVYAIGDSVYNKYIGKDIYQYSPLGNVANKHGYLLASNLSGDKRAWYGTLGSFATSYFDIKIAGTGLSLDKAIKLGHNAKSITLNASTKNSGFKNYKPNKVEIIYDIDKNIVLGAFAVGYEATAQ
ncbi:FAD-dependent oxidoreductase, partial [Oceanivirga salmonicida]|uniref:FAD-dependent oxidoreductase n=1 Tax=Oceanivirga salmonicida TaxID=1769291 RepID=UPI0012E1D115